MRQCQRAMSLLPFDCKEVSPELSGPREGNRHRRGSNECVSGSQGTDQSVCTTIRSRALMKRYAAELIGTFALVFCGTGAIVINQQTGGVIGHAGIAATFG